MRKIIFTLFILLGCAFNAHAQSESDQLRSIYDNAEENYNIGRLDEAEKELMENLKKFPSNLRQSAYRLLALCSLGNDQEQLAEERTTLLLQENPYFSPSANDPQRFIDMVERIKAGRTATITTASSQAENLNEVPVPTTLITEEMIRDCGASNLQEVLAAYVPGMHIVDCNDDINIAMRGIYSNSQEKILIMLNGHRLNSYCTNIASPDFSIGLEKLKQIEVLRGPASSLYGNVALTAVVNLITKQGADVDGIEAKVGAGSYGQIHGNLIFGKRYFDIDLLVWGIFYKSKGEKKFVHKEDTALGTEGDVTVGGIGSKPSYDFGASIKYKNLTFLYNTQYSQIQAPMTMTYLYGPYDIEKYKTYNGVRPSFTTISHHADLSYGQQINNVYLKGSIAYDNSDMSHYQVISDNNIPGFLDMLPLPETSVGMIDPNVGGFSRYISGQEHTFGAKIQGDWSYMTTKNHKGLLTFGAEYNYFQLDDARYTFGYDFIKTLPETVNISELGKGHENSYNIYAQLKHQWKSLIFNAGLRFDYKNKYDNAKIREFSPRLALIYVQPKWNIKLSYSKSFIDAPYLYRKSNIFLMAFQQLNVKGLTDDISPESLHSYQLTFGATQWVKGLNFELNAFYNKARDIIYMGLLEHTNSGNSDIYGLEFSGSYERTRFTARVSATWQKAKKFEAYNIEIKPMNMPEFIANGVFAWQATKHLKLHTHLAFSSSQFNQIINIKYNVTVMRVSSALNDVYSRYENLVDIPLSDFEKVMTPEDYQIYKTNVAILESLKEDDQYIKKDISSYFTVNLGATYKIGNLELGVNVHNLFDKNYYRSGASTGLIPQKGRWFMFDIAYKF